MLTFYWLPWQPLNGFLSLCSYVLKMTRIRYIYALTCLIRNASSMLIFLMKWTYLPENNDRSYLSWPKRQRHNSLHEAIDSISLFAILRYAESGICKECAAGYATGVGISYDERSYSDQDLYLTNNLTYQWYGSTTCEKCEKGEYSKGNASECQLCLAGYSSLQAATECYICDQGEYSPEAGTAQCISCSAGQYSSTEGSVTCGECTKGRYERSSYLFLH